MLPSLRLASVSAALEAGAVIGVAATSCVATTADPSPVRVMAKPPVGFAPAQVVHASAMSLPVLLFALPIVSVAPATAKPSGPAGVPAMIATVGVAAAGPVKVTLMPLASPRGSVRVVVASGAAVRVIRTSPSL